MFSKKTYCHTYVCWWCVISLLGRNRRGNLYYDRAGKQRRKSGSAKLLDNGVCWRDLETKWLKADMTKRTSPCFRKYEIFLKYFSIFNNASSISCVEPLPFYQLSQFYSAFYLLTMKIPRKWGERNFDHWVITKWDIDIFIWIHFE